MRQRWSTSHQFLQVIAAREPAVEYIAPSYTGDRSTCASGEVHHTSPWLIAARAPAVEYIAPILQVFAAREPAVEFTASRGH